MIGVFPEILPEELLYSAFARYAHMMGYPTERSVQKDLFGNGYITAVIDLPTHLDRFLGQLPPNHPYTADGLIAAHTMLPYYAPFVAPELARAAHRRMRGDSPQGLHRLLNASGRWVNTPEFLNFCRSCADEGLQQYGWAFWKRTHQAPGVIYCPTHGEALRRSEVQRSGRSNRYQFFRLSDETVATGREPHVSSSHKKHSVGIAQDTEFILAMAHAVADRDRTHALYAKHLADAGWLDHSGRRRAKTLERCLVAHYGERFLEMVGCQVVHAGTGDTWISRLLQLPARGKPPLCHLLLMRFLAGSAKEFFDVQPRVSYSAPELRHVGATVCLSHDSLHGTKAEPCRNPVCTHANPTAIEALQSGLSIARHVTVSCPFCGFAYVYDSDRPQMWHVEQVGVLWESELRRLVRDSKLTQREIASALGVEVPVLRKIAWTLGCTRPTWRDPRDKRTFTTCPDVHARRSEVLRTPRRAELLRLRRQFPDDSRTALEKRAPNLIRWLRRRDGEWLEANFPVRMEPGITPVAAIDWTAKDLEMLELVKNAVPVLFAQPGRPRKVTVAAIGNEIGRRSALQQNLYRLPETRRYLGDFVETQEEFGRRRVQWAAEESIRVGRVPGRWTLARSAGFATARLAQRVIDLDSVIRRIEYALGV